MSEGWPGAAEQLLVQADLTITIDGVDAHLTGDGSQLRLETENPLALLRRAAAAGAVVPGGRRLLTNAVEAASARGLTVVATGPRGPSLRVGAGVSSTLAQRVIGTPHVQLVIPRTQQLGLVAVLVVVAWAALRRPRRP